MRRATLRNCSGLLAILTVFLAVPAQTGRAEETLPIGVFTGETKPDGLPKGWRNFFFGNIPSHTRYTLEKEGDRYVIKAESRASASMLAYDARVDPKVYQTIRWRWKVMNILEKADPTKKSGDDYPARLYVTFQGLTALNYLWESKLPKGTTLDNPYTDDVKMIVVESRREKLGRWVAEERNLYKDYKKAFGKEPPAIIAVALMTDTDNTGESAVAYYADILLAKDHGVRAAP